MISFQSSSRNNLLSVSRLHLGRGRLFILEFRDGREKPTEGNGMDMGGEGV